MGFFRRYKLTNYTADECHKEIERITCDFFYNDDHSMEQIEELMEKWACFRELLARHEKQNKT